MPNREGHDLADKDQPMKSDRDSWVPAGQHGDTYANQEEEEAAANGETRGREQEPVAA